MNRSAKLLVVLAILGLLAFFALRWSTDSEVEGALESLSAFDALNINCPDIHETVSGVNEVQGTIGIAGMMAGHRSTGRVVGKTADGQDIVGVDGGVMVFLRPADESIKGQVSESGNPITAKVVGLDIDFSDFDDTGFANVCRIGTLESIKLENTNVTVDGLECARQLASLKQLCLPDTNRNLTDADIESLRQTLPACNVLREARRFNPHR